MYVWGYHCSTGGLPGLGYNLLKKLMQAARKYIIQVVSYHAYTYTANTFGKHIKMFTRLIQAYTCMNYCGASCMYYSATTVTK